MTDLPDTDTLKGLLTAATPGPWAVSPTDDTTVICPARSVVANIDGDYNEPDLWPIMEANARLIALAPSLAARVIEQDARIARLKAALALLTDRSAGLVHAHHHGNGLEGWYDKVDGVDRAITVARAALEDGQ